MDVTCRAGPDAVALETTLLVHGVPASASMGLFLDLQAQVRAAGAEPALCGVVDGRGVVGMTEAELRAMLAGGPVAKVNSANLGLLMHRGAMGATTVSGTLELAAAAGLRVMATGGIGGIHAGYGERWDVSSDLAALAHLPVAVVASGVKSILDVVSTREALESLGVPVLGYRTDRFPAFYLTDGGVGVDARFDDVAALASFVAFELRRRSRGILICHPVPVEHAIAPDVWAGWLAAAEGRAGGAGRDVTPRVLAALHALSGGATLRTNLALARANARLAGELAAALP